MLPAVVLVVRRRVLAVTASVVVGFFGFGLLAQSNERQKVRQAYTEWFEAHEALDPERICAATDPEAAGEDCVEEQQERLDEKTAARAARIWLRREVVVLEVDGDDARATLRAGPCTLYPLEASFRRGEDGHWRYAHAVGQDGWGGPRTYCHERGVMPPRLTDRG